MTEPLYKMPPALERALTITQDQIQGGKVVATYFRYYADRAMVCELKLPTETNGMISPDGVLMLISYLQRLVGGYPDGTKG